ncbi:hypothetical protein ACFOGI_11410 [Virgibacillus xinjiangensis]|uniref:Uncharacterized protein n=1 Tax=Virgibacillus xinjiangensis TaxID=393090 RepID=A0ABV7CWK0_9BACI
MLEIRRSIVLSAEARRNRQEGRRIPRRESKSAGGAGNPLEMLEIRRSIVLSPEAPRNQR